MDFQALFPLAITAVSEISARLEQRKTQLKNLGREISRDKLSYLLFDLFNISLPCLLDQTCDPHTMSISNVRFYTPFDVLKFNLGTPIYDRNSSILHADPFTLIHDFANGTFCLREYRGPKHLMTSRNCFYELSESEWSGSNAVILKPNNLNCNPQQHETKDLWKFSSCHTNQPERFRKFIQIKQLDNLYLIYCFKNNITIYNKTQASPNKIIAIPANINFEIANRKYVVRKTFIKGSLDDSNLILSHMVNTRMVLNTVIYEEIQENLNKIKHGLEEN